MAAEVGRQAAQFCKNQGLLNPHDSIVVGVSGGPDSLCLLHLLNQMQANLPLTVTAAHLNHQLRGEQAQADADFVANIAARWHIPLYTDTADVAALATARKQSIEEAARQARYAFLWRVAARVGAVKIAVGHNADDQVETVLMHFLRGSGLLGLRGMLPQTDIAQLRLHSADIAGLTQTDAPIIIRPLLATPRQDIEAYCREHGLSPRQDATNQDTTYFRNRLRHELIPYLESYNPNIRQIVGHTAQVIAADAELLQHQLDECWSQIVTTVDANRVEINLSQWQNLPPSLKRSTLRRAVQHLRRHLRDISFEHIETAANIIQTGKTGQQATLPQGLLVTVGYHTFTIAPAQTKSFLPADCPWLRPGQIVSVVIPGQTPLPGSQWQLNTQMLTPNDIAPAQIQQTTPWTAWLDAEIVGRKPILRVRRPGDIFCPLGMAGQRVKLNEFMINEKIPANQRPYVPLLAADEQILWVCGYRPDDRAKVTTATKQIIRLSFSQTTI
jgi:tRNA(Ile)-lysidine synthase